MNTTEAALTPPLRFAAIEPAHTALLVIDLQNFFVLDFGTDFQGARRIIPNVNRLTAVFRGAGATVVFTRATISDEIPFAHPAWVREAARASPAAGARFDRLRPGTEGHALFAELEIDQKDLVVDKHRYSAFLQNSSDLDAILRSRGIDTVVITGTATNVCCESTARDAMMLDYKVFFVSDANAAINDSFHQATLLNLAPYFADTRSTEEIIELLSRPRLPTRFTAT